MTESWKSAGPEFYDEVFQTFDSHSNWEYDDWVSRGDAPENSAAAPETGQRVEYRFEHSDTGAVISVGIPDLTGETPHAVSGTVSQGLTVAESDPHDSLLSGLEEAQAGISESVAGGTDTYVEPVEDLRSVARIRVPFGYDEQRLEESLDVASEVSERVDDMHRDVLGTIDQYAER